jgi:hypothetical protein
MARRCAAFACGLYEPAKVGSERLQGERRKMLLDKAVAHAPDVHDKAFGTDRIKLATQAAGMAVERTRALVGTAVPDHVQ